MRSQSNTAQLLADTVRKFHENLLFYSCVAMEKLVFVAIERYLQ